MGRLPDGTEHNRFPPHSRENYKDVSWIEAIVAVLRDSREAMHYADLTDEIARRGLRKSLGATPAATVAAVLSEEIKTTGRYPSRKLAESRA
jgi:hypothetical protein